MAPVHRYLRITKHSVLECRIYLDNPSLAQSWLLNPRNPILPRIIESIRPLVLPKLREENERSKKKSAKKKSIKDVIVQDEFEVSMFLTETSTRHSLLIKEKHFREKGPQMMQSNSTKLISETNNVPVDVDDDNGVPVLREEDSDVENDVRLSAIPLASAHTQPKIRGSNSGTDTMTTNSDDGNDEYEAGVVEIDSDADEPLSKQARGILVEGEDDQDDRDDKKKLAIDVSYQGFAIYGHVLCLVVRKRENKTQRPRHAGAPAQPEGQANMENWIASTQMPVGEDVP